MLVALEKLVAERLPLVYEVDKSGIRKRTDAVKLALTKETMPHGSDPVYLSIRTNKDQIVRAATARHGKQVAGWAEDLLRHGTLNETYDTNWSIKQIWIDEVILFAQGFRNEIPHPLAAG